VEHASPAGCFTVTGTCGRLKCDSKAHGVGDHAVGLTLTEDRELLTLSGLSSRLLVDVPQALGAMPPTQVAPAQVPCAGHGPGQVVLQGVQAGDVVDPERGRVSGAEVFATNVVPKVS
jgi:hypothetical protein